MRLWCLLSSGIFDFLSVSISVKHVFKQVKKGGPGGGDAGNASKEAETAESLLLQNKPFTGLMSLLTQLVSIYTFVTAVVIVHMFPIKVA